MNQIDDDVKDTKSSSKVIRNHQFNFDQESPPNLNNIEPSNISTANDNDQKELIKYYINPSIERSKELGNSASSIILDNQRKKDDMQIQAKMNHKNNHYVKPPSSKNQQSSSSINQHKSRSSSVDREAGNINTKRPVNTNNIVNNRSKINKDKNQSSSPQYSMKNITRSKNTITDKIHTNKFNANNLPYKRGNSNTNVIMPNRNLLHEFENSKNVKPSHKKGSNLLIMNKIIQTQDNTKQLKSERNISNNNVSNNGNGIFISAHTINPENRTLDTNNKNTNSSTFEQQQTTSILFNRDEVNVSNDYKCVTDRVTSCPKRENTNFLQRQHNKAQSSQKNENQKAEYLNKLSLAKKQFNHNSEDLFRKQSVNNAKKKAIDSKAFTHRGSHGPMGNENLVDHERHLGSGNNIGFCNQSKFSKHDRLIYLYKKNKQLHDKQEFS